MEQKNEIKPGDNKNSTSTLSYTNSDVEELLITKGVISKDQLEVAKKQRKNQGTSQDQDIGRILVEMGFITNTVFADILNQHFGIKSFDVTKATLDVNLIKKIPQNIALQYKVIPISLRDNILQIAISDIHNIMAFDQIRRYFDKSIKIIPLYCEEEKLIEILDIYYQYNMSIDGILQEIENEIANKNRISGEGDNYLNPTVRLIDAIFTDAVKKGASDLHFEPENNFVRIRYRIDGILNTVLTFHKDYWSALVVRIKILANMNIAESRLAQDGRISSRIIGREIDLRISVLPTIDGENIVIRILDRNRALMPITELGFNSHNFQALMTMLHRPEGIIIITGPTGCGKTTTLYSILAHLNTMAVNIMTLEDPIEYQLPLIRQSAIRENSNMSFANGIKSIMRQDPDIILVGEIRDQDTATMTIRAALTGHLVFSTLHTNDAFGVLPRLTDLGIQPSLLSGSIIGTIAQRLVRKLCVKCRHQYVATPEEGMILKTNIQTPPVLYRKVGCEYCHYSGYKGRIGIHEIMIINTEIADMIAHNASRKTILEYVLQNGFQSMKEDAIQKVLAGITDLEEIQESFYLGN